MPRSMPALLALCAILFSVLACGGTAIPSTSPDAVSTIVAGTMSAITPAASPIPPLPTIVPPTSAPASSVPPTSPVIAPTIVVAGATRINFLSGATTAIVTAPIGPGQKQNFVLQALQGQPMLLNVDSLNQDVTLSLKTQGGTSMLNASALRSGWQGTLPQTEDYFVTVYGGATTENFTLIVTIPSRIKFAAGEISDKLSGKTAGGQNVAYTVFAIKGQEMTVDLSSLSGDAVLSIYGFTDGQPYVRAASERSSFSFTLPATQDYIVQVVPRAGTVVNYVLSIKIV